MTVSLQPLQVPSLKSACVTQLEHLVLSGKLKINEKLPPERELAAQLQVSRPIVHQAIVDLASKGLVTIIPRQGTIVNDYRVTGSFALLSSLLTYHEGQLDPEFFTSLLDMRFVFEGEIARCAALHRTDDNLEKLDQILKHEKQIEITAPLQRVDLDFNFHQQLALASGNLVYPLLLNSFKPVYTNLTAEFYTFAEQTAICEVYAFHEQIIEALKENNPVCSSDTMHKMLKHGADNLQKIKQDQSPSV